MQTKKSSFLNTTSFMYYIVAGVTIIAIAICLSMIHTADVSSHNANIEMNAIVRKNKYLTMDQSRRFFKIASKNDDSKLMDRLDNKVVVTANGHKMITQINGGGFTPYRIHFVPYNFK